MIKLAGIVAHRWNQIYESLVLVYGKLNDLGLELNDGEVSYVEREVGDAPKLPEL